MSVRASRKNLSQNKVIHFILFLYFRYYQMSEDGEANYANDFDEAASTPKPKTTTATTTDADDNNKATSPEKPVVAAPVADDSAHTIVATHPAATKPAVVGPEPPAELLTAHSTDKTNTYVSANKDTHVSNAPTAADTPPAAAGATV